MTNALAAVVVFSQIVTNWGAPATDYSNYITERRYVPDRLMSGEVCSQTVVRVTLENGKHIDAVADSVKLEQLTMHGRATEVIEWHSITTNRTQSATEPVWDTNIMSRVTTALANTNDAVITKVKKPKNWWQW